MKLVKTKNYEIHSFLDNLKGNNVGEIIDNCINEVPLIKGIDYAGYKTKEELTNDLDLFLLDKNREHKYFSINEKTHSKILEIVKTTLEKLKQYQTKKEFVFIFPCFDKFTFERMNGSGGFCPKEEVILIFLNTMAKDWEKILPFTIAHEFAHSTSSYYRGGDYNISQGLIFEGLAEHFRENVLGGEPAPFSKAINKEEILQNIEKIKPLLEINNLNLHFEIFFGQGGNYPLWAGYSIGYYLVEKHLENKKNVDWNNLLRINPNEILSEVL